MYQNKFLVLGGDLRNIALADHLILDDKKVEVYGFSKYSAQQNSKMNFSKNLKKCIKNAEVIIGPIPCCSDNNVLNTPFNGSVITVDAVFDLMEPGQVFIAGRIGPDVLKMAKNRNIPIFDILERNEMAILNAIPTAEGVIQIAMEEMKTTLHGANVMVLGYGRIGKILCKMLQGIGANVFAVSRRHDDAAMSKSFGYTPLHFGQLPEHLGHMGLIVNTVPSIILDKHNLKFVDRQCLIIDVASKPFGVDEEACQHEGLQVIFAASLPGKVAPVTAAAYIKETVFNILNDTNFVLKA